MRALIAAAAVLAAAGGLLAQDKKYESKEGRYAVAFPGNPTTESKKSGDLTTHTAVVEGKGVAYWVITTDLPAGALKTSKPEELLASTEKGLVTSFKAKVTKSEDKTFGKEKYPSRQVTGEVVVDATTLHLRLHLVLVEGRVYQVLALGNKDAVGGAGTDKFFESFEIRK